VTILTNKALIESFIEDIFNKHDILATEKYFVKDSTTGSEEFKQFLSALFKAFPDMQIDTYCQVMYCRREVLDST
jgi:hypothetical protein